MNLNALDNLLYKRKNVLAHPLKPDVQHFAEKEKKIGKPKQQRGLCWESWSSSVNVESRILTSCWVKIRLHLLKDPVGSFFGFCFFFFFH